MRSVSGQVIHPHIGRYMPTIGLTLLHPQERIPRAPLARWADELRARLARVARQERVLVAFSERVGAVANNAALIAAQRGHGALARRLCDEQLWWQHRLSRRAGSPAVSVHCIQPWVNLARLDALSGACDLALERLRRLGRWREGRALALEPVRADGTGCQSIPNPGAGSALLLENVYVVETLRALLQNQRWEEAADFAASVPGRHPRLATWGEEGRVVALARGGDPRAAAESARRALDRADVVGWTRVVLRVRLAEAQACAGREADARAGLERIAAVARRLSAHALRQLTPLYVLGRAAAACGEVGMGMASAELAAAVCQGARAAADEVAEIEALRILVAHAPEAGWRERLDAAETATEYRRYRRPEAPASAEPVFAALYGDLEALFGATRGGSTAPA